jgi:hypothetical protein
LGVNRSGIADSDRSNKDIVSTSEAGTRPTRIGAFIEAAIPSARAAIGSTGSAQLRDPEARSSRSEPSSVDSANFGHYGQMRKAAVRLEIGTRFPLDRWFRVIETRNRINLYRLTGSPIRRAE